ncbi:fumarylacetoacetate hydrolase family protein [Actinomadura madurae]|uniref:2-keto-4-pentenoate hydratase/2-oxohepta-3-ene-1,7-dioic acid hydratase (Catechol pathway) n=1 Tax=Actinomadura madurae TaxID=1993 RepID=A0A1I5YN98_9ACTN|nr:fumarylacetoacetate hydrolase family protein [Actinomadura madurae]SFQ45515.1 2-keto-4-pentenoate hydratase/2-oxohepta-3-ene-1,7-dioic acid hydratase (catechol pathway) [Actinomadura madurae]SPT52176.1 Ureidoglycolate lyase [Actinomadura madurae]
MRFITYTTGTEEGVAIKSGEGYRGRPVSELGGDLQHFLRSDADLADLGKTLDGAPELALPDVRLLPPVVRPGKILCIGLNYHEHSAESGFEAPSYPAVFARFANSLVAHGEPLVRPDASDLLDYECELAAVIGKGGRHIGEDEALDHVAGYSAFNDGSVRDFQIKSQQWTMGKTFDGTGAFGPELVTRDELPPGCAGLRIRTLLNGETMQEADTKDMIFGVAALVSLLSEAMTLDPGDVIVTGTPGGVGALRDPQVWLKPGDECTIEIEQIGSLTNPIVQETPH